jgi:hypothetical protein
MNANEITTHYTTDYIRRKLMFAVGTWATHIPAGFPKQKYGNNSQQQLKIVFRSAIFTSTSLASACRLRAFWLSPKSQNSSAWWPDFLGIEHSLGNAARQHKAT